MPLKDLWDLLSPLIPEQYRFPITLVIVVFVIGIYIWKLLKKHKSNNSFNKKVNNDTETIYIAKGNNLQNIGQYEEAIKHYNKAEELDT